MNGRIVNNNILRVDELRPATTGDNYLLMKITVIAISEAEGHVLGLDEPDEFDSSSSSDDDDSKLLVDQPATCACRLPLQPANPTGLQQS